MIRRPPRSTPLSLHDALPIYVPLEAGKRKPEMPKSGGFCADCPRQKIFYICIRLDSQCPTSPARDRKSTRLNSSHTVISYAVFCLKKKKTVSSTTQIYRPYYH